MEFLLNRRQFLQLSGLTAGKFLIPDPPEGFFDQEPNPVMPLIPENTVDPLGAYLWDIAETGFEIGGEQRYNQVLQAGIGFATRHTLMEETILYQGEKLRGFMETNQIDYPDLTAAQQNVFDITSGGKQSIQSSLIKPGSVGFNQALQNQQYAGLIATRSPQAIGEVYLAYGVSAPKEDPRYLKPLGPLFTGDCPRPDNWNNYFSQATYSYLGWKRLPWIAEVSDSIMEALPPGLSNDPDNLDKGRPGLLLINQSVYDEFRYGLYNQELENTLI
jgi:hypothetical protein